MNLLYRCRQGQVSSWYYIEKKQGNYWKSVCQVRSRYMATKIIKGLYLLAKGYK